MAAEIHQQELTKMQSSHTKQLSDELAALAVRHTTELAAARADITLEQIAEAAPSPRLLQLQQKQEQRRTPLTASNSSPVLSRINRTVSLSRGVGGNGT